jgi:hypothetical protein
MRKYLLKGALALLVASAALLASGRAAPDAYAAAAGCNARCPDGSSCSADPDANEVCTCGCSMWGLNTSVCSCKALAPNTPG